MFSWIRNSGGDQILPVTDLVRYQGFVAGTTLACGYVARRLVFDLAHVSRIQASEAASRQRRLIFVEPSICR